jgi:hypothetical protein
MISSWQSGEVDLVLFREKPFFASHTAATDKYGPVVENDALLGMAGSHDRQGIERIGHHPFVGVPRPC